jgi:hypothetical protein
MKRRANRSASLKSCFRPAERGWKMLPQCQVPLPMEMRFVEGEGRGIPPPNSQGPDQCIFEGSGSIPQSDDGMVNLLLVLNLERIGRRHHLDVGCDFVLRTLVKALKDPTPLRGW